MKVLLISRVMKKYIFSSLFVLLLLGGTTLRAQNQREEYLGLPGDNLNLYAVMKLFQESQTLEEFERKLNYEDTRVNNLDLDGDGRVDYIRVIDNVDGNVHNIVLQVALNPRENQDVAVFTVWRESNDRVLIQLTGDEQLYGRDYIIEPIIDEAVTPNPGYTGNVQVVRTTTFEIAAWPLVRFIYMPNYVVWHSPWYYSYYPSYWRPWRPYYWDYYYGYHYHNYHYYYGHYRPWNQHRHPRWHDTYYSSRSYSPQVRTRIESGFYKKTYSRPEQRREGTALYYRTHPEERSRISSTPGDRTVRRGTSTTGTGRNVTNSGTGRRSTSTSTERRVSTSGGDRNAGTTTTRKSTTTTERKSTTVSPERRSTSGGTERKSTSVQTERKSTSTSRGSSSPRQQTERKATRSNPTRETGNTGSGRTVKKSTETKQSGSSSNSSGRRGKSRTSD